MLRYWLSILLALSIVAALAFGPDLAERFWPTGYPLDRFLTREARHPRDCPGCRMPRGPGEK